MTLSLSPTVTKLDSPTDPVRMTTESVPYAVALSLTHCHCVKCMSVCVRACVSRCVSLTVTVCVSVSLYHVLYVTDSEWVILTSEYSDRLTQWLTQSSDVSVIVIM